MDDLIPQTECNLSISNQNLNLLQFRVPNKNILLNKTTKSKSQQQRQSIITASTKPFKETIQKQSIGLSNQSKDNVSIQRFCLMNQIDDQKEYQNDMININQIIHQKKQVLINENKYFLKEMSRIRQNFEMNTKIRNKIKNDRQSTTSSQDKYEKCWNETLKELNQDSQDNDLQIDSSMRNNEDQFKEISRPKKRLKSQIYSKIREQEDQYFKECSKSIIKLMKQRQLQIVDQLNTKIEQIQLLKKEQYYQRSKEREEGKQEIMKSLKIKEQGQFLKLYQIQQQNLNQQQSIDVDANSFQKNMKRRSQSFNSVLPIINQKQDKIQNNHKQTRKTTFQQIK